LHDGRLWVAQRMVPTGFTVEAPPAPPTPEDAGPEMHVPAEFAPQMYPPGHYYSPIADMREIRKREDTIFAAPRALAGIDLREQAQLDLIPVIAKLCEDHPYEAQPGPASRYGFENDFFSYGDALVLHAMLRMIRPARYVEVGSGWSSALALDVFAKDAERRTECTFIEPYPVRLHLLLGSDEDENERVRIIESPLHAAPSTPFEDLDAGDVLFIDSTHVSRVGSDVNQLLFEVLPRLRPGVYIHIHDVFYPFEYIQEWVYAGRNWTEDYLLRAYLIDNPRIEIVWFNSYMARMHRDAVASKVPEWDKNPGGSLWLKTI
jgi:hypothetical protein